MKFLSLAFAIIFLLSSNSGFGAGAGNDTAKRTFESAMQALNAGEYPRAEAGFRKVLELDPHNFSALTNLGVLYARTHRYTKAIEIYKQALDIRPQ